jgi:hypothetical protein
MTATLGDNDYLSLFFLLELLDGGPEEEATLFNTYTFHFALEAGFRKDSPFSSESSSQSRCCHLFLFSGSLVLFFTHKTRRIIRRGECDHWEQLVCPSGAVI